MDESPGEASGAGAETPKKHSVKERLLYGLFLLIALTILLKLIFWAVSSFLEVTYWPRTWIDNLLLVFWRDYPPWLLEISGTAVFILILLPATYLLGHVEISKILRNLHLYWLERRTGQKFLFCVKIKDPNTFPGKHAIGCVTKVYLHNERNCYAICYPNLGGLVTYIDIEAEDTVPCERSPGEVLLASFSFGALITGHNKTVKNKRF